MVLNENVETFIMYVTSLNLSKKPTIIIHLVRKTSTVLLFAKEIKILAKYLNFSNIFLEKKALVLPKLIKLN